MSVSYACENHTTAPSVGSLYFVGIACRRRVSFTSTARVQKSGLVIINLASGVDERIYRVHLSSVFSWAVVVSTGANRC